MFSSDVVIRLDGNKRADARKKLHENVRLRLEKKSREVAKKVYKGQRRLVLEPGDGVWVHLRKDRCPTHRQSKFDASRGWTLPST